MNEKPVISLFSSAVHPDLWMRMYNSLTSNKIPFEVIFVGNNPPKYKLPDNCHFIYSETKPAQCSEIGGRYAAGELIMNFADDVVFSEHALDNLYEEFRKLNDDKVMLSCRYILDGEDITDGCSYYWADDHSSPIIPITNLMKKEIWEKIGGIDKNFIASHWQMDIAMRFYEMGGRIIISKNAWIEEFHPQGGPWKNRPKIVNDILQLSPIIKHGLIKIYSFLKQKNIKQRLFIEFGVTLDAPLLDKLWVIKSDKGRGIISKKRLAPVEPFEDKHILTVSQGPRGRWN